MKSYSICWILGSIFGGFGEIDYDYDYYYYY